MAHASCLATIQELESQIMRLRPCLWVWEGWLWEKEGKWGNTKVILEEGFEGLK